MLRIGRLELLTDAPLDTAQAGNAAQSIAAAIRDAWAAAQTGERLSIGRLSIEASASQLDRRGFAQGIARVTVDQLRGARERG